MPAFPAPEGRDARVRHGAPAMRAALAAAAATVLLTGCAIAESDTDRLGRKAAPDAVDAADAPAHGTTVGIGQPVSLVLTGQQTAKANGT
ncbi:hypothetical protein OG730_05595 [Streptomyces sp. NBC_01298]|uniref:hypothetical protein n=1 Tax=Streptomyces sp. NBC_01298 TaxID=2903817 RepID=UPI002E10A7FC|nr:hypothetical protein OG730_05595 [Streptomyces sp. NBC_01298]